MRILIVSNMNASQPYGAWARTNYLGEALSKNAEVCQLGIDTSDVSYGLARSTHSKHIPAFMHTIRQVTAEFLPDVIYCHESFPAVAGHLSAKLDTLFRKKHPALVFDIHALHAAEYKAMLSFYESRAHGLYLFAKAYYSQRIIARSNSPIIAASDELKEMLIDWYRVNPALIHVVPNGAPTNFLTTPPRVLSPFSSDFRNILMVAPKNMKPNELAVKFTIQMAQRLHALASEKNIRIIIVGGGWQSEEIEKSPNLKYLGFVDDLLAHIDHSDICLLPYPREAICGGARNKSLDFFSRGKVVLSTAEGLRGLSAFRPGEHVFISDDAPEKFAQSLLNILDNLEANRHIGENARRLVLADYNWDTCAQKVLAAFQQIL